MYTYAWSKFHSILTKNSNFPQTTHIFSSDFDAFDSYHILTHIPSLYNHYISLKLSRTYRNNYVLIPLKNIDRHAGYSVIVVNNEVKLKILKLASQPSNSLNIINLTPKNHFPFSPIMFLLLCTPWAVFMLLNSISVYNVCICHLP